MPISPSQKVHVHADVLQRGWAGYVRHGESDSWDFHCTIDTVGQPLETVPLSELTDRDPSLLQIADLPNMSQAWRWERGDDFQISRLPTGPTFFYEIEARPTADHPSCGEIDFAMINCWVRCETESEAMEVIRRELADWTLDSIYGPETHTPEAYREDSTGIEYYQQAQTDGEVFVIEEYVSDDD